MKSTALAIALLLSATDARAQKVIGPCVDSAERETIRNTVLRGIDNALEKHVINIFDIWMKDPHSQPKRAIAGMEAGISAHIRARRNALKWDPVRCPPEGDDK